MKKESRRRRRRRRKSRRSREKWLHPKLASKSRVVKIVSLCCSLVIFVFSRFSPIFFSRKPKKQHSRFFVFLRLFLLRTELLTKKMKRDEER